MKKLMLIITLVTVATLCVGQTFQDQFFKELNFARSEANLNPLAYDEDLEDLAEVYVEICRWHGGISHTFIRTKEFIEIEDILATKYIIYGEVLQKNIALISKNILFDWLFSSSHYRQLMHPDNKAVGVAWVEGDSYYIVAYTGR